MILDAVKYNKISAIVFIMALDTIPFIRDGKGDVDALISFNNDMKQLRAFRKGYNFSDEKVDRIALIDQWNNYMKLRNEEDFIPHSKSNNNNNNNNNNNFYQSIF